MELEPLGFWFRRLPEQEVCQRLAIRAWSVGSH